MRRREFITKALIGGGTVFSTSKAGAFHPLGSRARRQARAVDSRIEILLAEPIGRIAPEIYGHFAEHLGGVIYDGIWVGENSKVANIGGIRKALVEALRLIKPAVVRWPGGCFADSYNWRDGIGARSQRPRRPNFWAGASEWQGEAPDGPWKYEPNQFGTNEFARFCKLVGAQPYFAANLRSLPAKDFYEWVEYCNAPAGSTTLAQQRAAAGDREPFNVRYWGVGNESWGCGGNFTPEEYAAEFRRFTEWVPGFKVPLSYIGSGPNGGDLDWTRRFFAKLNERRAIGRMWGWALHHYSWNVSGGRTNDWQQGKGDAVNFPADEWYELLHQAEQMESLITRHWAAMGELDRQHHVKLVVDEWGAWYKPGTQVNRTHLLGQQSTIRDAVLAGLTLDTFHRHADKVAMANIAQLINCLQGLFLAHEDKFAVTPTYHVFRMYAAHQGNEALRTIFSAPPVAYQRNGQAASLPGLAGSASRQGKEITLTVTNPDPAHDREAEIEVRGQAIKAVRATLLTSPDLHACNSFDNPRQIEPKEEQVAWTGGTLIHHFAPASVTRLQISLA